MNRFLRLLPAVAVAVLIYYLSSLEGAVISEAGLDNNVLHIGGHFVLYILLGAALFFGTERIDLARLLGLLYAISDELHQTLVPGRAFQVSDILIDYIGIYVGVLLLSNVLWKFSPRLKKILKK